MDIDENTNLFKEAEKTDKRKELNDAVNNLQLKIDNEKNNRARMKSIRRAAVKKRQTQSKKGIKIALTTGALLGALALAGLSEIADTVITNLKINSAFKNLQSKAQQVLLDEGLADLTEDGEIIIRDNEISDYKCLDLTNASSLEQHIYSEVLGREFDDAIQTASYDNGGYYYTGTNQWRNINGFIDMETGNPSKDEERAAMRDELLEAYDNDCEGIIRTAEELHYGTAMRGR